MTIHSGHPFATPGPDRDPARRLRGRLGGAVTLWTAGEEERAGLTVSSVMLAGGEPARILGLLDPDSDLLEVLRATGRGLVHVLDWRHRDLADAFAGVAPAPGGPFRLADFGAEAHGPRLLDAPAVARVSLESATETGWSVLVSATVDSVEIADEEAAEPLLHLRGRYRRLAPPGGSA